MNEQIFRTVVNSLWAVFMKAETILNTLESIGLTVEDVRSAEDDEKTGLYALYAIQDRMAAAVVDLLGIREKREQVVAEIDEFLLEEAEEAGSTSQMSDEQYEELIRILKTCKVRIPWEESPVRLLGSSHDRFRRYRAVSKKDNEAVTGYIWAGADHMYITPGNLGVSYDKETGTLTAHAVEVYPETIAVDQLMDDDEMTTLFEGDKVRIGDDEFILDPMDPVVLQKLASSERREKGLFRVKTNYEVLQEE